MKQADLGIEQESSTRERVLTLLASRPHTVDELAKKTGVSKNAIRAQMATLGREGIIEAQGIFRSTRRPATLYGLSPGSDLYFSKAYPHVLSNLIHVLANRLSHEEFIAVMKELGERLASSAARPTGTPRERIETALKFLRGLGSLTQIAEEDGHVVITGHVCPIARAVAADARACTVIETLLRELTGLPVEEHCNRGERQSCRFTVKMPRKKEAVS
jgi:predicted ArsR family transcriptional regulator